MSAIHPGTAAGSSLRPFSFSSSPLSLPRQRSQKWCSHSSEHALHAAATSPALGEKKKQKKKAEPTRGPPRGPSPTVDSEAEGQRGGLARSGPGRARGSCLRFGRSPLTHFPTSPASHQFPSAVSSFAPSLEIDGVNRKPAGKENRVGSRRPGPDGSDFFWTEGGDASRSSKYGRSPLVEGGGEGLAMQRSTCKPLYWQGGLGHVK